MLPYLKLSANIVLIRSDTVKFLVAEEINGKILLHTGDIGYIDNKGLVHYKARLKRMIITSGYNVYPANIEEIIMKHEAISSCAVIGVPDQNKGEIVKAFITLKEGKNAMLAKVSLQKYLQMFLLSHLSIST